MRLLRLSLLASLLGLAASPAGAGQVRVDVGDMKFTPQTVTLNHGDHVVWIWKDGNHSVTSGTACAGDGLFDSGVQLAAAGVSFGWKSGAQTDVTYFCVNHCDFGMTGQLHVGADVPVADLRLSELRVDVPGGQDLIEITNHGAVVGDLGEYRLAVRSDAAVTVPLASLPVAGGGQVVIHCNATGTNTATDIYLSDLPDLPDSGSVALYVPDSAPGRTSLADATQIIDFVQWGRGGGANEATAALAGLWGAGQAVPPVGPGHSLELCDFTVRAASSWAEIAVPNFGGYAHCATPARTPTWGQLKTLYR